MCRHDVTKNNNIAIIGDWGIGKTTFLSYIKKHINERNNKDKKKYKTYKVIDFNAAEYASKVCDDFIDSNIERQWSNIIKVLLAEYESEMGLFSGVVFNFNQWREKKNKLATIIIHVIIFILFILSLCLNQWIINMKAYDKSGFKAMGLFGSAVLFLAIVVPLLKTAYEQSIPLANRVIGYCKIPNYIDTLGARESITRDMKVLINSWLKNKDERIIIFVDDLDRCSNSGIMEFFEAMHLFIDFDKLFFVFAIDDRLLCDSIAQYYNLEKSKAIADQFLDKYVSEYIFLEAQNYSSMINDLKEIIEPKSDKHCLTNNEYVYISELIRDIDERSLSPRIVKKVINKIAEMKYFYIFHWKKKDGSPLNLSVLFSEVILCYFFKYFYTKEYEYLLECIESISYKNMIYLSFEEFEKEIGNKIIKDCPLGKYLRFIYVKDIYDIEKSCGMMLTKLLSSSIDLDNTIISEYRKEA